MPKRLAVPENRMCAYMPCCGHFLAYREESRYCSSACRAKASHARRYQKRPVRKQPEPTVERVAFRMAAEWLARR